jgi:hypothetical protein
MQAIIMGFICDCRLVSWNCKDFSKIVPKAPALILLGMLPPRKNPDPAPQEWFNEPTPSPSRGRHTEHQGR